MIVSHILHAIVHQSMIKMQDWEREIARPARVTPPPGPPTPTPPKGSAKDTGLHRFLEEVGLTSLAQQVEDVGVKTVADLMT